MSLGWCVLLSSVVMMDWSVMSWYSGCIVGFVVPKLCFHQHKFSLKKERGKRGAQCFCSGIISYLAFVSLFPLIRPKVVVASWAMAGNINERPDLWDSGVIGFCDWSHATFAVSSVFCLVVCLCTHPTLHQISHIFEDRVFYDVPATAVIHLAAVLVLVLLISFVLYSFSSLIVALLYLSDAPPKKNWKAAYFCALLCRRVIAS